MDSTADEAAEGFSLDGVRLFAADFVQKWMDSMRMFWNLEHDV